MKTLNLSVVIILLSLLFVSCSDESEELKNIREFAGYYKISAIRSSQQIDMNNDGIQTNDILAEISGLHVIDGEVVSGYYTPELFIATINPLPDQLDYTPSISFNYPYQYIQEEDVDNPLLLCYMHQFLRYSYELKSDGRIEIYDGNPVFQTQYGTILSAFRVDDESFLVNMMIKLYDFKEKDWTEADIQVQYTKVRELE